jgi:hypothetical protein
MIVMLKLQITPYCCNIYAANGCLKISKDFYVDNSQALAQGIETDDVGMTHDEAVLAEPNPAHIEMGVSDVDASLYLPLVQLLMVFDER